jgi:hypothetical protein
LTRIASFVRVIVRLPRLAAQGFVNVGLNLPRDFGGDRVDRGGAAFITPEGREELTRLRAAR